MRSRRQRSCSRMFGGMIGLVAALVGSGLPSGVIVELRAQRGDFHVVLLQLGIPLAQQLQVVLEVVLQALDLPSLELELLCE